MAVETHEKSESPNCKVRLLRQQPELLNVPGALLRIDTVAAVVGFERATIYRRLKEKKFPAPIKRGARCTRWTSDSIRAYLSDLQMELQA